MSIRNLEGLLGPKSVAVFGASNEPRSVGAVVMRNLLRGGFAGPVLPVNPRHQAVAGVLAYPDVKSLPLVPELAVLCTPPETVPEIVRALADAGSRAAIVLTAGLGRVRDARAAAQRSPRRGDGSPRLPRARAQLPRLAGPRHRSRRELCACRTAADSR